MGKPIDPFLIYIPRADDLSLVLPGFETIVEAEARKQTLERGLRRAGRVELANRLAACAGGPMDEFHCLSGACPICMRAWRRWFFAATSRVADAVREEEGHGGCVVSLVPRHSQAPPTLLHSLDLKAVVSRIRQGLDRLELGLPVIGGLDISFNEDARKIQPSNFQIHANFAVFGLENDAAARRDLGRALASVIRLERTASRPILVQPLRDRPRQVSYMLKSSFVRRLSIVDGQGRANTLPFAMKMAQTVEVATLLDSYTLLDRLILHGATLRGNHLPKTPRTIRSS
jgi:hypothetical protein